MPILSGRIQFDTQHSLFDNRHYRLEALSYLFVDRLEALSYLFADRLEALSYVFV